MHIQEGTNTTLTTCSKMTEEVDRRHGVNGNGSSKAPSEDAPGSNSAVTATGGRLKFFKDGKFILELVRGCGRAGERAGWVSVPRKTFWPPAAPAPHAPPTPPAAPAASAASLSASDDNSSVHSSPWQRDHCWKQPTPRRNRSKELALYYCRPSTLRNAAIAAASRRKRRRPHDDAPANGLCEARRNGDAESDSVDGPTDSRPRAADDDGRSEFDREKYYRMKLKKPYQYHKLRVYTKTRPAVRRKELRRTVERLRERAASQPAPAPAPAPLHAKLASCRHEHAMVSPRKRILRELERVSLEDQSTKRRAKTVPALSTASYPPSPGPSHAPRHNGTARKEPPAAKHVGSYSIQSLLSMPDEGAARRSPDAKRSPHSHASLKTESPSSAGVRSPDLSPSPDGFRYRYSALALGSPGPGARDSPTPPCELARYRTAYAAPPSPYGPSGGAGPAGGARAWHSPQYRGSPGARDEWREAAPAPAPAPMLYGYPYGAPLYRAPAPPLWMHYALAPGAPHAPPGPWAPLAHPLLTDHIPKEEPTSDLPLNLSKH